VTEKARVLDALFTRISPSNLQLTFSKGIPMKNLARIVFVVLTLSLTPGFSLANARQEPTRAQIEDAVRQQKVLVGMEQQDVYRAWGRPKYGKGIEAAQGGDYEVWFYARANVYFLNGIVKEVRLVR
jgi:hypothetical protein